MAINTVPTKQTHIAANNSSGNTSGPYAISFDYLDQTDVEVRVANVLKTQTTHYTFPSKTSIQFTSGNFPTVGAIIEIKRNTDITTPKVDFEDGSVLTETDLDNNSKHLLFGMQETKEDVEGLVTTFVGASAPTGSSIVNGARWYDTVSGRTFIYYVDVDTAQWVEANPPFDAAEFTNITNTKVAADAAIDSTKLAFTQNDTGAVARTIDSRLQEITSVKDYGATGDGSTDDTTAFSNAVKAADAINNIDGIEGTNMPRADMCRVHVPAGTYKISSLVDTNNREVVYIVDQAAKFTSGSNNHLNGEIVREGQFNINTYQHGSTDYAAVYAIRANTGSSSEIGGGDNLNAEILGLSAPNQLAVYQDRDSVALYVDNENALPLLNVNSVASYTATTVTLASAPSADVLKRYRKGMIIDTKHTTPFVGVATSWSANGQTINVQTGWYQYTSSLTPPSPSTPTGTDGLAIGFKKVWAHNANVHVYNGGYAERACGFELGIRNYKADSNVLFSNDANRIWGFDAVNLSGANDGAGNPGKHGQCGFIARTSTSNASWQHGFMAQNTINGFTAYSTTNNPFQYTDFSNNVIFRVANDGSLQLGRNNNGSDVPRFIDFHSGSENNDFDSRIASVGGTTNDGEGNVVITAATLTATGGTFNLGANNSGVAKASLIDFHSSGENNDFDGRITFFDGDTNDGKAKGQVQCKRFGIIVNGSDQRWGFLSDGGLAWVGHNSFNFDSVLSNGYLMANGFSSKAGIGASAAVNNAFNIYWTSTVAQLYIDSTNLGTITLSSDYRIKKDITTQTASGIDKIKQLRPVNYEYTDNTDLSFKGDGVKREGFIAHEVAEVIPSAVDGEKDATNQVQSLRVDAIVSVLTKALQEAVAKIEVLEAKVASLEG